MLVFPVFGINAISGLTLCGPESLLFELLFQTIWVSKQLLGSHYVSLSIFFDIPFCEVLSTLSFFMLLKFYHLRV